MTKPATRLSVGAIARTLWLGEDWDWDAAYAAAYAYKWGVSSPRTWAQALGDIERSIVLGPDAFDVAAVEAAYRRVKVGQQPHQEVTP
jgi:hypothetical protein